MDEQKLAERFDTLWFFSNILSHHHPPPPPPSHRPDPNPPPLILSPHSEEAEAQKITAYSHDPTAEPPAASATAVGRPIPTPPPPATAAAAEPGAPALPKLDQRRTRRRTEMGNPARRSRRPKGCREQGLGQLEEITPSGRRLRVEAWRWDSGLPSIDSSLQRTVRVYGLAASGRGSSVPCSVDRRLGDDLAVREHLRSWAHAVACTVR